MPRRWPTSSSCAANSPGAVRYAEVRRAGLTEADCLDAVRLEEQGIRETGLYPGMPKAERRIAIPIAEDSGQLRVTKIEDGVARLQVVGISAIHHTLRGKPILHLDATLRPELAATVLPGLATSPRSRPPRRSRRRGS